MRSPQAPTLSLCQPGCPQLSAACTAASRATKGEAACVRAAVSTWGCAVGRRGGCSPLGRTSRLGRQQLSRGRSGRTRTRQEATPSARDSDKGKPQRAEPFREGSMLGDSLEPTAGDGEQPGVERTRFPLRPQGSAEMLGGLCQAGATSTHRHKPTGRVTSFIARRWGSQGAGGRRAVAAGEGGWRPALRRAQPLGHRRTKEPRLQRKSGWGCSGRGSTDTRRRAPRWLSGMQSDTRTSRGRPSLERTGEVG